MGSYSDFQCNNPRRSRVLERKVNKYYSRMNISTPPERQAASKPASELAKIAEGTWELVPERQAASDPAAKPAAKPTWGQTLLVYLEPASLRMLCLGFSAGLPL
ncbi:MAG: hypothetical protein ORN29_03780, partial [Rhodoferax sp.]|nr:hypothetical protein [Rhodoferax sp.]